MRILLTNNHLNSFGGTETWVLTVYNTLKRKGHDVDVYSPKIGGGISDYIGNCYNAIPNKEYDLALVNHNTCMNDVRVYNMKTQNIDHIKFISHGTIPSLEQPTVGADDYIAISEEVRDHMKIKGFNARVVLNPIDLDVYRPTTKINKKRPKSIFSLCQNPKANANLTEMGLPLDVVPGKVSQRERLSIDRYNNADIVVGLGRSAFEGLACGRAVMVYDERSYNKHGGFDGFITAKTIDRLLTKNCSGRVNNHDFNVNIINYLLTFQYQTTDLYRSLAEQYFDANKIVDQLIEY